MPIAPASSEKDIEKCYDTRQVFLADYPHGTHSVLSPWHVEGRYLEPPKLTFWQRLFAKPDPAPKFTPRPAGDVAWVRVAALAKSLPPADRLAVMSRYARVRGAR